MNRMRLKGFMEGEDVCCCGVGQEACGCFADAAGSGMLRFFCRGARVLRWLSD